MHALWRWLIMHNLDITVSGKLKFLMLMSGSLAVSGAILFGIVHLFARIRP